MIKTLCLGLLAAAAMCSTAAAEFAFSLDSTSETISAGGSFVATLRAKNVGTAADTLVGINVTFTDLFPTSDISMANLSYSAYDHGGIGGISYAVNQMENIGTFTFQVAPGFAGMGAETFSATVDSLASSVPGNESQAGGLTFTVNAVPEPTSVLLFGSLMTLGMIRRRSV